MTRDDIIRMAREAGATVSSFHGRFVMYPDDIERFAAIVAAAAKAEEREECAKLCDWLNGEKRLTPAGCAALIRATSNP
jgi:hypothetical protein